MNGSQPRVEWTSVVTIRSFAVACTTTPPLNRKYPCGRKGLLPQLNLTHQSSPVDRFSEFTRLKRITAWILRFVNNACSSVSKGSITPHLTVSELVAAEDYWMMIVQRECFPMEVINLKKGQSVPQTSRILPFRPIWDENHSVMRVGGRMINSCLLLTIAPSDP